MTQHRWRTVVAGLAVAAALLAGCSDSAAEKESPDVTSSSKSDPAGSDVPMETVLEDYRAMRAEMVAALDAELGERDWGVSSNNPTAVRAGCRGAEAEGDGETIALESFSFPGTYDEADWRRSAQIVQEVGREHGFTETGTTVDAADDLQVFGEDDQGGRYVYGLARNTVLGISTGCHVWRSTPEAESPGTGEGEIEIPDYDKSEG